MSTDRRTRAWVEIDASALRRNYRRVQQAAGPGSALVPMVKADAYGLGVHDVIRVLEPLAPHAWGVATVDEGAALRAAGVTRDIHVHSPLTPDDLARTPALDLIPTLSSPDELARLAAAARAAACTPDRPARFQLEVDTGMGRAGATPAQLPEWRDALAALAERAPHLRWVGLFTHFHSADEPGGPGVAAQHAALVRAAGVLGVTAPTTGSATDLALHCANSAGAFRLEGAGAAGASQTGAIVRPGIFLYGGSVGADQPSPEPVVAVRARVVRVADVAPGTTCGYGATYTAAGSERWATLAVGYADGIRRTLSGRGHALVGGQRAPFVGRVSMDTLVANITGLVGVEPGSIATLLGCDGDACIPLDELAAAMGTISYEVLTGLGARLPRIWTDE